MNRAIGHVYAVLAFGLIVVLGFTAYWQLWAESSLAARRDNAHQVVQQLSIKRGLIRYVNRTPLAQDIQVTSEPSTIYAPEASDPWNHWIFSTSVRALLTGEEAVKTSSVNMSASANRTTDEWKMTALFSSLYSSSTFELGEAERIESTQRSYAFTTLAGNSVGKQLSIGGRASAGSSTSTAPPAAPTAARPCCCRSTGARGRSATRTSRASR